MIESAHIKNTCLLHVEQKRHGLNIEVICNLALQRNFRSALTVDPAYSFMTQEVLHDALRILFRKIFSNLRSDHDYDKHYSDLQFLK